jgi:hypothetical protein
MQYFYFDVSNGNSPSLVEIHSNSQVAFYGHKQLGVRFSAQINVAGNKKNQRKMGFKYIWIYTISQSVQIGLSFT